MTGEEILPSFFRQNPSALRQALTQAVDLFRGDLLPGCYDEWILPERDRLRQVFFTALERLIVLLEQERDEEAAISASVAFQVKKTCACASSSHGRGGSGRARNAVIPTTRTVGPCGAKKARRAPPPTKTSASRPP